MREREKERKSSPKALLFSGFYLLPSCYFTFRTGTQRGSEAARQPGKAIIVAKLVDNLRQAAQMEAGS